MSYPTYADVKAVNPEALTPWKAENVWQAYAQLEKSKVRGTPQRVLADIISLITLKFPSSNAGAGSIVGPIIQPATKDKQVDAGPEETPNAIFDRTDDRLVVVEGGIDDQRNSRQFVEVHN